VLSANINLSKLATTLSILLLFAGGMIYANSQLAHAIGKNSYVAKVSVDKPVIKRGQTQTIEAVVNPRSGIPVTGTTVAFTINYADLKTTRQASVVVDGSGHASYSWQIEDHVKPGYFNVNLVVSGPGLESQSFPGPSFIVQEPQQSLKDIDISK
jgi:hypothetical protein